ncbi:MAG TPA: LptF/LptG family permease [Geminicoccaceae bacterium]|nr:LptF/LptG family permease [Geminicoccus sp.]HMU51203.1 LptF/LptG family permease [Geminicoccaceae bacterium]
MSRYVLVQTAKPMAATLLVALLVLMAERMLRVVDLVIGWRGSLFVIFEMLGYLMPHYMGLALPASFFIGILMTVNRLSRDGEIDAMMAAGTGLPQLIRPLIGASLVLVVLNYILVGYIQPYSRYAYRAAVEAVTNASFLTLLQPNVFTTVDRTTAMVEGMSPDKTRFDRVFLFTRAENGDEVAITAERGVMRGDSPTDPLRIELEHGVQQALPQPRPNAEADSPEAVTLRFRTFETTMSGRRTDRMEPRGQDERELTIPELIRLRGQTLANIDPPEIEAELHGRVVRTMSIPLLPFLGVPLALGRRRTHRSYGLILGLAALIAYNQVIRYGESVVDDGRISAVVGIWLPYLVFGALSVWLYMHRAYKVPSLAGGTRLDALLDRLVALLPRRWRRVADAS